MNGVCIVENISKYSGVAVFLHWVVGILIIANIALGLGHELVPEDEVRFVIDTHKSIGITVLGLAIMRLLWRITHTPPALPTTFQRWEAKLSHATHWLLYILIFALPISGWMHDSAWKAAAEHPMRLFNLFEWPRISAIMNIEPVRKEQLHDSFGAFHTIAGYVLIGLVLLHILGALKHQFIDKHPELQRMWR